MLFDAIEEQAKSVLASRQPFTTIRDRNILNYAAGSILGKIPFLFMLKPDLTIFIPHILDDETLVHIHIMPHCPDFFDPFGEDRSGHARIRTSGKSEFKEERRGRSIGRCGSAGRGWGRVVLWLPLLRAARRYTECHCNQSSQNSAV